MTVPEKNPPAAVQQVEQPQGAQIPQHFATIIQQANTIAIQSERLAELMNANQQLGALCQQQAQALEAANKEIEVLKAGGGAGATTGRRTKKS